MYEQLGLEQQLVLLTNRLTFTKENIDQMEDIVHSVFFNWFEFT